MRFPSLYLYWAFLVVTLDHQLGNLTSLLRAQDGARPWFCGQRSTPFIDAQIDFDLRTAFHSDAAPKTQPRAHDKDDPALSRRKPDRGSHAPGPEKPGFLLSRRRPEQICSQKFSPALGVTPGGNVRAAQQLLARIVFLGQDEERAETTLRPVSLYPSAPVLWSVIRELEKPLSCG